LAAFLFLLTDNISPAIPVKSFRYPKLNHGDISPAKPEKSF